MKGTKLLKTFAVIAAVAVYASAGGDRTVSGGEINKRFIGIEGSYAGIRGDTATDSLHYGEGGSFGIRLGAQYNEWRAMVVGEFMDGKDGDQDYQRLFVQADYFFLKDSMTGSYPSGASPYIGLSGGLIKYEATGLEDIKGWTYGGQAGCTFGLSENLDVDIGVRYSWASKDEIQNLAAATIGVHLNY